MFQTVINYLLSTMTLSALEIVLGIDNFMVITMTVMRLPNGLRKKARFIGMSFAFIFRILFIVWMKQLLTLNEPLFRIADTAFSWKSMIVFAGGAFLIGKAITEINNTVNHEEHKKRGENGSSLFWKAVITIVALDIVFSLDTVLSAIAIATYFSAMIIAIAIGMAAMFLLAEPIGNFVDRNPSVKLLALSFLIVIGYTLVQEGLGKEPDRTLTYGILLFGAFVEYNNLRYRWKAAKLAQEEQPSDESLTSLGEEPVTVVDENPGTESEH